MRQKCWIVEPEHLGPGSMSPPLAIWDGTPTTEELLRNARADGWVVRGPYVLEEAHDAKE